MIFVQPNRTFGNLMSGVPPTRFASSPTSPTAGRGLVLAALAVFWRGPRNNMRQPPEGGGMVLVAFAVLWRSTINTLRQPP